MLAADSAASSQLEVVQPESNRAVPVPGNALAERPTAGRSEEDLAQSMADLTPPRVLPSVDNAIDQLTADLAAFCIDQLERSATLCTKDRDIGDTNDLEDELQVRFKS